MSQIEAVTPAWMQRRVSTRSRLRGVGAALGMMAGLGAAAAARPAAAASTAMIYYAGSNENGQALIGGAMFAEPAAFVAFSTELYGAVLYTHYILASETWFYDGTYQFLTATPYWDLANDASRGFMLEARCWDNVEQVYTNSVRMRLGSLLDKV